MAEELKRGTELQGGRYRIEGILGQGTFGITYLATEKIKVQKDFGTMDQEVKIAIKEFFMSDVNGRKADGKTVDGSNGSVFNNYLRRFRKEAENLSKLTHPNIVIVFDVFDENDTSYYAMRYINGDTLDHHISNFGKLSEKEAIAITLEIGDALEYLHSRRILHLDIKPGNVMRNRDGRHYLIDFGLSKQFSDAGEPESSTSIGLGTPGYSPIEQSSFKKDGTFPATIDVYSLGATLYKMLTGKRPPVASFILNESLPTDELEQAGVSEETISVLKKAMMPIYKYRYQSVTEFLTDLEKGSVTEMPAKETEDEERTLFEPEVGKKNVIDLSKSGEKKKEKPDVPVVVIQKKPDVPVVVGNPGKKPTSQNTTMKYLIIAGVAVLIGVIAWLVVGRLFSGSTPKDEGPVKVEAESPYQVASAEESFRQAARMCMTTTNEVYFYGTLLDNGVENPVNIRFSCSQDYTPSSCIFENLNEGTMTKMRVYMIGNKMRLVGKDGGCDFTVSIEPGADGNWTGTTKKCQHTQGVTVYPVEAE
ncbi:MAG: serine/threonine protein kinase [Muribaculaceae bacterium]|nr:serine/threonine protein kinase [Muribaculaceae bacterium]